MGTLTFEGQFGLPDIQVPAAVESWSLVLVVVGLLVFRKDNRWRTDMKGSRTGIPVSGRKEIRASGRTAMLL